MVFSSTVFLFLFLPITLLVYYILRGNSRNIWLLIVSLVFFFWSQPQYLWIILLNIFVNYLSAMLMQKEEIKKKVLWVCILANLGLLIYFKYFNFMIDTLERVIRHEIASFNIILPIGISFFTFQGMSYAIDVYRREVPVQKDPLKVALYIVLFPQLIAGPIVRYKDVVTEIDERKVTLDEFASGIERFIIGLGKKVIIANTMAGIADAIWNRGPANNPMSVAWLGSIAYMLQIFYDFSGYSDMAIGLGRMFGFHFNENFDLPYISRSITEFWRRWHISLSTWFRDYVYIPLGGNRRHVYRNLCVVFLLTGIWHGASWNFILWGVWNGIFMLAERILKQKKHPIRDNIFGLLYTLFIVNIGWVLFRAATLADAAVYLSHMFVNQVHNGLTVSYYMNGWNSCVAILGILFASSLPRTVAAKLTGAVKPQVLEPAKDIALLLVFLVCIFRVVAGTYNPFIYFQF